MPLVQAIFFTRAKFVYLLENRSGTIGIMQTASSSGRMLSIVPGTDDWFIVENESQVMSLNSIDGI